jgi:LysR family transcriptional regulator, glycine cleavage system transcriptional activator
MSLRKLLPSPGSLFMFEAAARHLNFTHAAREFNVTQSAMSRSIGLLESHLGMSLFRRLPSGLELTEEGQVLSGAVGLGFRQVESTLRDLRSCLGDAGKVRLSVSSAFAMHWFMPRMDRFRNSNPDIDLRFQLVHGEPAGPVNDADLAIRYLANPNNDLRWQLTEEIVLPVCSPDYLSRYGGLDANSDLSRHVLAHLSGTTRIPWSRYLTDFGYPSPHDSHSMTFSDYALVVQAAVKGRAIALGWWHVVANELAQHTLVPASHHQLITGDSYFLVAPGERPLRKSVTLVRDWLLEEMSVLKDQLGERTFAI